jgi:hypothetical protein
MAGVGGCSYKSATQAMWANVWATSRSDSLSSPTWLPNNPSAPDNAGGAHRHRVHGGEARFGGGGDELGPPRLLGVKVRNRNRLAGNVAVQAGALVGLKLKQLEGTGFFRCSGHEMQMAAGTGKQQSSSDPGRPSALETRPTIGVDSTGSPTPAGANRSRDPCARMPTG